MENKFYGIDIGGTSVKIGLFEGTELISQTEIPTDRTDGGKNILPDIAAVLTAPAAGAGIAVPGAVLPDGTVNRCVNLGWGVFHPGHALTELTGLPAVVLNDANAAALGEQWRGAGAAYQDILCITVGTGIGGGVIVGGRLVSGANGAAGEIGHFCVNPQEEEACGCGLHGCLEQYTSATGITRLSVRAGLGKLSAKDVFARAQQGDADCLKIVDTVTTMLGRAAASACAVFDPQAVILGGGVSRAGEILRAGVEAAYRKYAFHACSETAVLLASLGNDAGICGAARLAMQSFA